MKAEQGREVHRGAARAIAGLDRFERRGFKYALQLGIRGPDRARAVLRERRAAIVAARQREGVEVPRALRGSNDELRQIDWVLGNADRVFTPRLARVAEVERRREVRVAASDPGLAPAQRLLRRYAQVAEHLGLTRGKSETVSQFVRRVQRTAERKGLARPGYFPSEKRPSVRYGDFAVGGAKAAKRDKAYSGALFRTGRENVDPMLFPKGLARSIKRKHNWRSVADSLERHAFPGLRGKSIARLRDELDARRIDPDSVAFWNPGRFRDARNRFERSGDREQGVGEDLAPPGVGEALDEAALDFKALERAGIDGTEPGWSVIPKAICDELHAETRPSGTYARSWDVVKGKQARVLLGAGNLPWLANQVGSNVLLTALAKTGPVDAVKAQRWWKGLSDKERAAVEPYVGLGPHHLDVQQTKLGASTNSRLVNGYRAFKAQPAAQRASKLNPIDALFRVDNAQNNFFRRAVLYSQVKRNAYREMRKNAGLARAAQAQLTNTLKLGPKEQMRAIIRDHELIEAHARSVNLMLGDYVTFTAKERRILGRAVMFYGFLRFSLKFAFWTMPTRHPVMTSLIGNLSRLQTQEVRELLGGDELPWAFGRLYIKKNGELEVVDMTHANPAANQLLSAASDPNPLAKAIGLLPPVFGAALDLAYDKSAFRGRALRVEGETSYGPFLRERAKLSLDAEERLRVGLANALRLFYPYRVAEQIKYGGEPQGDDTLIWDPRPTRYKDEEVLRAIDKQRRQFKGKGGGRVLLEELSPWIPRPSRDPEFAAQVREAREAYRESRRPGLKSSDEDDNPFNAGGGGGERNPFSGSASGGERNPFN